MREMYGAWEIESFKFYQVPKALFVNAEYARLSAEAKILYGILFDRMKLSAENDWIDEDGNVFIYYSVKELREMLNCGKEKIAKLQKELMDSNLLVRKRQPCGKVSRMYVLRFSEVGKSDFKRSEKPTSRDRQIEPQEVGKTDRKNNTNKNNTDFTNTNLSIPPLMDGYDAEETEERFKKQIEYDILCEMPVDKDILDEIVLIAVDAICGTSASITIGGNVYARETVRSRLFKLDSSHIQYVIDNIKGNTTKIHNVKAYVLSMLYNAPATLNSYYTVEVGHDLYGDGR